MNLSLNDYSLFATHSYEARSGDETAEAARRQFNGASIVRTVAQPDDGFFAVAYELADEIVISYEGTNFGVSVEAWNDAFHGWSGGAGVWHSTQSRQAVAFFNEIDSLTSKPITTTGHSLGGGLAALVASIKGTRAVVFDNMPFESAAKFAAVAGDAVRAIEAAGLTLEEFVSSEGEALKDQINAELFSVFDFEPIREFFDGGISLFVDGIAEVVALSDLIAAKDYQIADSSERSNAEISGAHINGEVLEYVRLFFGSVSDEYDGYFGASQRFDFTDLRGYPIIYENFEILYSISKHSVDLLSTHIYLDENRDRFAVDDVAFIGGDIVAALFDNEIATGIGFGSAAAMFRAIALAAADPVGTPRGTVALDALFSDAADAGRILDKSEYDFNLGFTSSDFVVRGALANGIVAFAGGLANLGEADEIFSQGFLRSGHEQVLTVDYSSALWAATGYQGEASQIVGRAEIIDRFDYDDYFGDVFSTGVQQAIEYLWGEGSTDAFERLHYVRQYGGRTEGVDVDLDYVDNTYKIAGQRVQSGAHSGDVIVTTDFADTVIGSRRNELFDLGVGDDVVAGGEGDDIIIGGGGSDALSGGGGSDVFLGTAIELNGDRIVDLEVGDRIHITDARFSTSDIQIFDDEVFISYEGGPLGLTSASLNIETAIPEGASLVAYEDPAGNGTIIDVRSGMESALFIADVNGVNRWTAPGSAELMVSGPSHALTFGEGGDLLYYAGFDSVPLEYLLEGYTWNYSAGVALFNNIDLDDDANVGSVSQERFLRPGWNTSYDSAGIQSAEYEYVPGKGIVWVKTYFPYHSSHPYWYSGGARNQIELLTYGQFPDEYVHTDEFSGSNSTDSLLTSDPNWMAYGYMVRELSLMPDDSMLVLLSEYDFSLDRERQFIAKVSLGEFFNEVDYLGIDKNFSVHSEVPLSFLITSIDVFQDGTVVIYSSSEEEQGFYTFDMDSEQFEYIGDPEITVRDFAFSGSEADFRAMFLPLDDLESDDQGGDEPGSPPVVVEPPVVVTPPVVLDDDGDSVLPDDDDGDFVLPDPVLDPDATDSSPDDPDSVSADDNGEPPADDGTSVATVSIWRGGAFSEHRYGSQDADKMFAGGGDDTLTGRGGADRLYGQKGDDLILGHSGSDTLQGGGGQDSLNGGGGRDLLNGGGGRDMLKGGLDLDILKGAGADDTLKGGGGSDRLFGQRGNDKLKGQGGDDRLVGGGGNDRLSGDAGSDTLKGGFGRDQFVFQKGFGEDVVLDFKAGVDLLNFRGHRAVSEFGDLEFSQSDGDLVVSDGIGGLLTLRGVGINDIGESDFIF